VALVTGGGRGIGAATCGVLAADGLAVAVADLNERSARDTAATLPGSAHRAIKLDVRDEASVADGFAQAEREIGPVTVLICAAGGTLYTRDHKPKLVETTLEDWDETESLNARGTFLCTREYLKRLGGRAVADGRIITFSSLAAQTPGSPAGAAYSASKAAIIGLTRYVAHEVAPLGITANAICPGSIDTPAFRTAVADNQLSAVIKNTPTGRIGRPADIADMIAYLVSPKASFITGSTFDINGGRFMR
jgi:NAD(P)-dependent dehydrogenase (short-subunit alcohol dehydrogenase family)